LHAIELRRMTAVEATDETAAVRTATHSLNVGPRARLEILIASPVWLRLQAWLLGFGFVVALGANSGGYWPTAWGWSALLLLFICALALLVRSDVHFGVLEAVVPTALLALVCWNVLSALWGSSLTQPAREAERTLVYAAAVFAALLLVRPRSYGALLGGVWAAITLVAGYGLLTRLLPERLGSIDELAGYRLAQPLGYWNALGIFAAMGALLALGFAARGRKAVVRALAAASTLVLIPAFYFTFSRGAWIALGVGLLAAVALDRRRLQLIGFLFAVAPWPALAVWIASRSEPLTRQGTGLAAASHAGHRFALDLVWLAAGAAAVTLVCTTLERRVRVPRQLRLAYAGALVLVVAGALAVVVVQFGSPPTIARNLYHDFVGPSRPLENGNLNKRLFDLSGGQRIPQWKVAWRDYEAHPWLGSGSGSYERYWNQLRPSEFKVRNAHSLYLETLAEVGPVGLALLLATLCLPLVAAVKARGRSLASVAFGAYAAFLVHAGVDWDWQMPALTLAALFSGTALLVCTRRGSAASSSQLWRAPALALMLVLAVFAFVALRGNRAVAASETAATKLHWTRSAAEARAAQRWAPWSSRPWQLLGEAQFQEHDLAAARASFRKALEKDGSDWSIWLDLALASKGKERRHAFAEATRLNPLASEIASRKPGAGRK
jgi:O-Antigen ligase